jgi:hypothetical protein
VSKLASEDPSIKKEFDGAARDENLTLGDKIESGSCRKANYGESEREDGNEVVLFLHSCIICIPLNVPLIFFVSPYSLVLPFLSAPPNLLVLILKFLSALILYRRSFCKTKMKY